MKSGTELLVCSLTVYAK